MSSGHDPGDATCVADVTRLLGQASSGDAQAVAALLPLVYDQLRQLAHQRLRRERADQTLQATALVHEAYLRIVDHTAPQHFDGRGHFFAAAAEAMRRILVEQSRRRASLKRGGRLRREPLDDVEITAADHLPGDLLALDEALTELAREYPERATLVKLRYFAGLSIDESARALGISPSTVDRYWVFARAWLYRRMSEARAR
jgi:RNA polymerase sigma factor (TIGR02999 family)